MKREIFKFVLLSIVLLSFLSANSQTDCDNPVNIGELPFTEYSLSTESIESGIIDYEMICIETGSLIASKNYIFKLTPSEDTYINLRLSDIQYTNTLAITANTGVSITKNCFDSPDVECIAATSARNDISLSNILLEQDQDYYIFVTVLISEILGYPVETDINFNIDIIKPLLNQIGITSIISPANSCDLTNSERITVEIKNYGPLPQSNFPVNFSIGENNWLPVAEICTEEIASGSSILYTSEQVYDFSALGEYEIIVKTEYSNDGNATVENFYSTVIASQPVITLEGNNYEESFESGPAGWIAYGSNSSLELATPQGTIINSAGDGNYSWVTNASGYFNSGEKSYLESPCFDFTNVDNPIFKAMIQYETSPIIGGISLDSFYLEYKTDGEWTTLSSEILSENWYGSSLTSLFGWNGTSNGWITVSTSIQELANLSNVKFRFVFSTGLFSTPNEGIAIDKIEIYECNSSLPNPDFSFEVSGLDVMFTNLSQNADSYLWGFGNLPVLESTSEEENPFFTYYIYGTYNVTLIAYNECWAIPVTKEVVLECSPLAVAEFDYDINVRTVSFTNQSENGESYYWYFGNGLAFSTEENPQYTYNQDGQYSVTLMVVNSCGTSNISKTIDVSCPQPIADFDFAVTDAEVQFTNLSQNADSYIWSFGDVNNSTSVEENPSFTYENSGTYTVRLEIVNSCGTNSESKGVEIIINSVVNNNTDNFKIYPNPASEYIYINAEDKNIEKYELLNVNGQILGTEYINGTDIKVNLTNIVSGTYYIKIYSEKDIITIPFVKE